MIAVPRAHHVSSLNARGPEVTPDGFLWRRVSRTTRAPHALSGTRLVTLQGTSVAVHSDVIVAAKNIYWKCTV